MAAEKAVRPEGLSAEELQKELDVSYRTAWSMLRRLRCAMVSDRVLDGRVDVDIVSCAHLAGTLRQTRTVTNTWIMVAVKERKVGASYAQAEVIAAAPSRKTLIQFVRRCVEPLSTIIISKTEPLTFLPSIAGEFDYEIVWHDGCSVSSLPRVRDVLGRYKEWMINTHGKVAIQYLQRYLNEFTFRFNHRRRGPDPIEIIRNSLRMSPLPDVLPAGRSERTGVRSASRSFG